MSELTKCNYCTLQYLKKNLKPGYKLSQIGNDIYIHPESIEYYDMTFDEREKYWRAWLMEIPDHCVC